MRNAKNFIERAIKIHGNKYDYSLVDYINARTKVRIICPTHGIFEQIPDNHTTKKYGCPICSSTSLTTKDFIERAIKIHGDKYDYSLVDYLNSESKVRIICPTHGIFEQKARKHLEGNGCNKCCIKSRTILTEDFIEKAKEVHIEKYDYSLVNYINAKTKVQIICPTHGIFIQLPRNHIHKEQGCPKCKSSHGETRIRNLLIKNNIPFEEQKRFDSCKNILTLPFDFYLPSFNLAIEFQGEQHYVPMRYIGGIERLLKTKTNDRIKKEFCFNNKIKFLEISYKEVSNIENIILTTICTGLYQDQS